MSNSLVRWVTGAIQALVIAAAFWGVMIHSAFWVLSTTMLFALLGSAICLWAALRLFTRATPDSPRRRTTSNTPVPALTIQSPWIWGPIVLLGLITIAQTVPLPVELVGLVSPKRVDLAHRLSLALPELRTNFLTISVDPGSSRKQLPFLLFPIMAFILGNFLASSRKRARTVVRILIYVAIVEGLYALAEQLSGHMYILWIPYSGDDALGTFVNRNHFAAIMSLFLPVTIGWLYFHITHVTDNADADERLPPTSWDILTSRHGLWVLAPVIIMMGIIQSHSRGGFSSMLFGIAIMIGAGLRSRVARTFAAAGIVLALVTFVYTINSDYRTMLDRFEELQQAGSEDGRVTTWRNSMGIVRDYPLFGIGPGNFADVYRQHDKESTGFSPYQAHNEWLEGLLTFGFIGMCPLYAALVFCFVKSYRIVCQADRDKPWLLGVWCGLLGLVLHSFVEFTFHSPGIIIPASLLMGLLLGFERLNKSRYHEWRRSSNTEQQNSEHYEVRVSPKAYSIRPDDGI